MSTGNIEKHSFAPDDNCALAVKHLNDSLSESVAPAGRMLKHFKPNLSNSGWQFAKRMTDIVFASVAILAFALPMLVIAVALKLYAPGPVFFAHQRVGKNGRMFPCIKFRTMVVDSKERLAHLLATDPKAAAEFEKTRKLTNDPRVVPIIGALLRKTSLDELPQFFNVLRGDMSVVGPRPVTQDEIDEHYGTNHPYLSTRPGITGLWQVSGRNDMDYSQRVALDAEYVRTWNLINDLKIMVRTAAVICKDRNGL